MIVNIEDILKMREQLNKINNADLRDIDFFFEDTLLTIPQERIDEWVFIGLNNVDFITTGFYKDGEYEDTK